MNETKVAKRRRAKRGHQKPYLRADGRWSVTIDLGRRPDGRRWRLPVYGRSPREVLEAVPDVRRRALAPKAEFGPSSKLREWAVHWIESVRPTWDEQGRRTGMKHSSWRGYEKHVRLNIVPLRIGNSRLKDLDRDDVQAWQDWLGSDERGLGPRSVEYARVTLGLCLEEARKRRWISENPVADVSAPRLQTAGEATIFTLEQARRFLRIIKDTPDEALYLVSIFAGPRQGETLSLRISDYDSRTGVLTFKHTLDWIEGAPSVEENKNATSRRSIRLPRSVRTALERQIEMLAIKRTSMPGWKEYGFLFPGEKGQARRGSVIYRRLHKILAANDLPILRWHDLRHSAASLMLALGLNLHTVKRLLGQSSLQMISARYGHLVPELAAAELETMESALLEPSKIDVVDATE